MRIEDRELRIEEILNDSLFSILRTRETELRLAIEDRGLETEK